MRTIKVFFDTEFTGLTKDTTLISIGMVAQDIYGKWCGFYHEFTDYDTDKVNGWIEEMVISNLFINDDLTLKNNMLFTHVDSKFSKGDKETFKANFDRYIKKIAGKEKDNVRIMLVSDCSSYDHVLFNDIYGSAFDIPDYILPQVYDIVHDVYKYLCNIDFEGKLNPWEFAFNMNREDLAMLQYNAKNELKKNHIAPIYMQICKMGNMKHNAYFDAMIIAMIHHLCA